MSEVLEILRYAEKRALGLLPWFMLAVVLGALLQHLRIDLLTKGSLRRRSATAVVTTALFGALTPFCAGAMVPLIRSLLIAGVPLSMVMAFWIASPAVSPELFGLTAAAFGFKIAVARLAGAVVLAMGAALAAHVMERRGMLPEIVRPLKRQKKLKRQKRVTADLSRAAATPPGAIAVAVPGTGMASIPLVESTGGSTALLARLPSTSDSSSSSCCGSAEPAGLGVDSSCCDDTEAPAEDSCAVSSCATSAEDEAGASWSTLAKKSLKQVTLWDFSHDVARDSWLMGRWLLIAVLVEALVVEYVPKSAFDSVLGGNLFVSVVIAALLSIPLYLNGVSAIPMGASLVAVGMSPAALTTFFLAGSITTLPAIAGVRAIAHPRIFYLYLITGILGSIVVGLAFAPFVT